MQIKTQAIVLHTTRVSDRSSILHLYTKECGRIAYGIYLGSKRTAKHAMLMPLALLDIEASHAENKEVQQLRDWQLSYVASRTTSDIYRQTIALFIAEILYRTLAHPLPDPALFEFLEATLHALNTREDPANVHLEFLLGYIDHLGFGIDFEHPASAPFLPILEEGPITHAHRRQLLHLLMDYYAEHLPDFHTPKSLDVMMQVFS